MKYNFELNKNYNNYFFIGSLNELKTNELQYIEIIKKFIIEYFEKLGVTFDFETRYILKGKQGNPMFVPKTLNPLLEYEYIMLSVENYSYWCQVIYQLSHELTHCFIYCHNKNENKKSKWIEETICEAISLYFLKYFGNNWEKCFLSKFNMKYNISIKQYLNDILKKNGTKRLTNCKNLTELIIINETSEYRREDRLDEIKKLFELIDEKSIVGLINYKDYVLDGEILLDCNRYTKQFPSNKAVSYLCKIQSNIVKFE